jgi:hypothetical protein
MTQLFDQMTAPDPVPLTRTVDVRLELDRLFTTPDSVDLDLSRFFAGPPSRGRRPPRTPPGAWLRAKAPGVVLIVAGAFLGVAVARL